jgi:DNA polymerase elongation subunit (family B)
MSSLQLYQAVKDDILIPWKKREPETFKSAWELLIADRGGFIFEPKVGLHDWVGEVDFASMYPTLMAVHNISAETVLCSCCPDSTLRVPELGYNICQKRVGIVPNTLRLILKKRADYKQLRNETQDPKLREAYDRRQNAHNVFQAIAASQLASEGIEVSAGQTVRYLITDAESRRPNRRVRVVFFIIIKK